MSVFKVGDRVRIVYCALAENSQNEGREATIIGRHSGIFGDGWRICIDGVGDTRPSGFPRWVTDDQIEPLTPPGQKEFKAEDVLTLEGLPDFNIPTMTPEFARAWGGA